MSRTRRLTTAATLLAGVLVLAVMAIVGVRALTAPLDRGPKDAGGPDCPAEEQVTETHLRRGEVTVSVFNAGGRKGQAQKTLEQLEEAGFKPGEVGNAPKDMSEGVTKVYTSSSDDAGAQLVALILGKKVPIADTDEEYGPGVDVFIGKDLGKLNRKAPRRIKLNEPIVRCVD